MLDPCKRRETLPNQRTPDTAVRGSAVSPGGYRAETRRCSWSNPVAIL